MKTAVIYWSGTGNTEAMANAVAEGMKEAGAEVTMLTPDQVQAGELGGYGAIAFGCPAMGSEVLEEMDFQPMFDACKNMLSGKRVALFGSFGWGDGQWMRDWESDCSNAGISLTCESVTCCDASDDAALEACLRDNLVQRCVLEALLQKFFFPNFEDLHLSLCTFH